MTMSDMTQLQRCHDKAVSEMSSAAVVIAELVMEGKEVSDEVKKKYRLAKLACDSTRRDVLECISTEAMAASYREK